MRWLSGLWAKFAVWIAGGAAVLAALLFLLLLWALDGKSDAEAERNEARLVAEANERAVSALQAQQSLEGRILRELRDIRAGIAADAQERQNELDRLANENADVQADLDYRYSLDLVCLRDRQNGVRNPDCSPVSERGAAAVNAGPGEPR